MIDTTSRKLLPQHPAMATTSGKLWQRSVAGRVAVDQRAGRQRERLVVTERGRRSGPVRQQLADGKVPVRNGPAALLPPVAVMFIEALGTAILMLFIFALVDRHNRDAPSGNMAPFFIGFSVAIIISVLAPLTQAGLNPARDLGPRLFALLAGWGTIALPGPNGVWWAYVVGPFLGGTVGATLYDVVIRTTPTNQEQDVVY